MADTIKVFGLEIRVGDTLKNLKLVEKLLQKSSKEVRQAKKEEQKIAEEELAKSAQAAQEKTRLTASCERKLTDLQKAGAAARKKMLKDATDDELNEYLKLTAGTLLAETVTTEIKQREAKKRAAIEQETKKGLQTAQTEFTRTEKIADAMYGTDTRSGKRREARLKNELQLRSAQAQAYTAQLKQLEAVGAENSDMYAATINNLADVSKKVEGLKKGSGFTGWLAHALGLSSQEAEQLIKQAYDLTTQIGNAIFGAQTKSSQRRLKNEKKAIEAGFKTETKLLNSRRDKGLISEKRYQKELEKLEAKKAEKEEEAERAAFEREKKINIKQALMNTALGIMKTFAQMGWLPGLPFAALLAAQGAIQLATIKSQKFARGGLLPLGRGMGVIAGRSHSQGGHHIYLDGQPIGEVEGGELLAIVNKHDTARIGALSAVNSIHGRRFAQGGMVSPSGYLTSGVSAPVSLAGLEARQQAALSRRQEAQQAAVIGAIREETRQQIEAINRRIDTLKVVVLAQDMTDMQGDIKKIKVKSSW